MPRQGVSKRSFFSGLVAFCLPVFALVAQEGDDTALVPVKEIPDRFFQVQGSNGFFWQAVKNGAITSGETQYLQSGLNLLVDGENFAPAEAKVRQPGAEVPGMIELSGKLAGVAVVRSLLFDRERGAVRVIDAFENTTGEELSLPVDLRTTYPFGWESLHGSDGGLLSSDPVLSLDAEDGGLIAHFSATEGRHDTLIVCGKGSARPRLIGSTNRRELTLQYQLTIPAGKTVSLLHYISQITIPEMDAAEKRFAQFLRPGVDAKVAASVINFPQESFVESPVVAAKPGSLVALNQFLGAVGVYRRSKDLLWLSPTSQLTGDLSQDAVLIVSGAPGEPVKLSIREVAAVRGGSGIGRPVRVFLRDGTVLSGSVSAENLTFTSDGETEPQQLDVEAFHLLLSRTSNVDGIPPEGTMGFLQTTDGEVIALAEENAELPAMASWGPFPVLLSTTAQIRHVSEPLPSHRVVSQDGSRVSVFLAGGTIEMKLAGGAIRELPATGIAAYWKAGLETVEDLGENGTWLDFSEVPERLSVETGFLLQGNQMVTGEFADSAINIRTSGPVIRVETARIRSLRRSLDVTKASTNRYQVELKNGESLEGDVVDNFLTINRTGSQIRVSFDQLHAYRAR